MNRLAPLLLAALSSAGLAQEAEPRRVLQGDVNESIDRGVRWLLGSQAGDGSWFGDRPGRTALALYALLKSGVDPQSEPVQRAIAFLATHEAVQTYDVAILAQALTTLQEPEYQEWIEVLAQRLVSWQLDTGEWSYPGGDGDLSNTQYAALGLWVAGKTGLTFPADLWRQLFDALQRYVDRQGGFGYSKDDRNATLSMTAAGVGTLAICAWGLGAAGELPMRTRKQIERAEERGLEWLAERFEEAVSPGRGPWPYYRLYGIERVGGLLGVEQIDGRDWYQEGAARLLAAQNEDGSWSEGPRANRRPGADQGASDPWVDVNTSFALLFLRRATSFTGPGGSAARRTVFGTESSEDDVQVRATGRDPLTVWITGWGAQVRKRFEWPHQAGKGPHVSRVEYLVEGKVVATVEADPLQPAGVERFEVRCSLPRSGAFLFQVRATVHAAPREGSQEPGAAFVLSSAPFRVEVAGVVPQWLREQLRDRARNLMPAGAPGVRASSSLRQDSLDYGPEHAVDNFGLSVWLAQPQDTAPTLTITLAQPQTADLVLFASPRIVPHAEGHFSRPLEVEVAINEGEPQRVLMPPDERRKARLELPAPVRIKRLDVTIRWKAPGRVESTGLAEVELQKR